MIFSVFFFCHCIYSHLQNLLAESSPYCACSEHTGQELPERVTCSDTNQFILRGKCLNVLHLEKEFPTWAMGHDALIQDYTSNTGTGLTSFVDRLWKEK